MPDRPCRADTACTAYALARSAIRDADDVSTIAAALAPVTHTLIAVGGVLYSAGVVFHAWRSLRFQNAIWHGFVLSAAFCHYAAVLTSVTV